MFKSTDDTIALVPRQDVILPYIKALVSAPESEVTDLFDLYARLDVEFRYIEEARYPFVDSELRYAVLKRLKELVQTVTTSLIESSIQGDRLAFDKLYEIARSTIKLRQRTIATYERYTDTRFPFPSEWNDLVLKHRGGNPRLWDFLFDPSRPRLTSRQVIDMACRAIDELSDGDVRFLSELFLYKNPQGLYPWADVVGSYFVGQIRMADYLNRKPPRHKSV